MVVEEEDEKRSLAALLPNMSKSRADSVAGRLLQRFGTTGDVFSASSEALAATVPDEPRAVDQLNCVRDALQQVLRTRICRRPILSDDKSLTEYLTFTMGYSPIERFRILFLDARNRLIVDEVVANGCVRGAVVHPREIMRRAVEVGATALIVVHNHPSGDPTPSRADVTMTQSLSAAAGTMGIILHDHLIVARSGYTSLRRLGQL